MNITETDDVWRLYRREWVTVHTATHTDVDLTEGTPAEPVYLEAVAWVNANLSGRVRDNDINLILHTDAVTPEADTPAPTTATFWAHVQVYKDNLKGEFKHNAAAEHYADAHGYEEYTVVPRNSKIDHETRAYGVKML